MDRVATHAAGGVVSLAGRVHARVDMLVRWRRRQFWAAFSRGGFFCCVVAGKAQRDEMLPMVVQSTFPR